MIWEKITIEEYLEKDGIRSGLLADIVNKSPLHAMSKEIKLTPAMLEGQLFHTAVLEPELLPLKAVTPPTVKKGKMNHPSEEWETFLNECYANNLLTELPNDIVQKSATTWLNFFRPGVNIIDEAKRLQIEGIQLSISQNRDAEKIIKEAEKELTAFMTAKFKDQKGNEYKSSLKTRPDLVHPENNYIADLKFVDDAKRFNPLKFGYDIQSALHLSMAKLIQGIIPKYYWIVIERSFPHGIILYSYDRDSEFHKTAVKKMQRAISIMQACIVSQHWPNYSPAEVSLNNNPKGYIY